MSGMVAAVAAGIGLGWQRLSGRVRMACWPGSSGSAVSECRRRGKRERSSDDGVCLSARMGGLRAVRSNRRRGRRYGDDWRWCRLQPVDLAGEGRVWFAVRRLCRVFKVPTWKGCWPARACWRLELWAHGRSWTKGVSSFRLTRQISPSSRDMGAPGVGGSAVEHSESGRA